MPAHSLTRRGVDGPYQRRCRRTSSAAASSGGRSSGGAPSHWSSRANDCWRPTRETTHVTPRRPNARQSIGATWWLRHPAHQGSSRPGSRCRHSSWSSSRVSVRPSRAVRAASATSSSASSAATPSRSSHSRAPCPRKARRCASSRGRRPEVNTVTSRAAATWTAPRRVWRRTRRRSAKACAKGSGPRSATRAASASAADPGGTSATAAAAASSSPWSGSRLASPCCARRKWRTSSLSTRIARRLPAGRRRYFVP